MFLGWANWGLLVMVLVLACSSGPESSPKSCDPAYPTVCISSPLSDLNCGDISHRRFKVLKPDPHGFDRDKDGIGCESG